jgi:ABC-type transporter Mla subunit MlaD
MGFLDKARAKATEAVNKHGDKINQGLDKAGNLADKRTQGRHSDKIANAKTKAAQALDKLNQNDGRPPSDGGAVPPPPPR